MRRERKPAAQYSGSEIREALKEGLAPEVLGRVSDVVLFASLGEDHLKRIVQLHLAELCDLLVGRELLTPEQSADVLARTATLRSHVLKERVGSVRSQAAARYEATPAEIVAAANFAHPTRQNRRVDEDAIAEGLALAADLPYRKIDPVKVETDLVARTLSRPFAMRHVVIPLGEKGDAIEIAIELIGIG